MQYHTGRGNFTFDTFKGKSITRGLNNLAEEFDLSMLFGTAPQDYTLSQYVSLRIILRHLSPLLTGSHTHQTTHSSRSSPKR